jgi:peptide/nickel transport system ATP-binding protein
MSPRRRRRESLERADRFPTEALEGPLLEVKDVTTHFRTTRGVVHAVDGVSFTLDRGRTIGVVGESGSGKTVLARSIMGLLPKTNVIRSGSIKFEGREIGTLGPEEMRGIWGSQMAMVFQDPMTSLNPVMKVGKQVTESLLYHLDISRAYAAELAEALFTSVGIPEPKRRLNEYPHQLSGGLRQRVMIAIALACGPKLLFADEPTTALDVTVQAQILDLLQQQQRERFMAMILVTHDLGVVADIADRVAVMYAGRIVEEGTLDEIFYDPQHPYTWGLLGSITRVDKPRPDRLPAIAGLPPSLANRPEGCHFRPRCPHEFAQCTKVPPLEARLPEAPEHRDRCWLGVDEKRARREVAPGEIGLAGKERTPA